MNKQPIVVEPSKSGDRQHSIWTFQPNQVHRLIYLIRDHNMRVAVNAAGTMATEIAGCWVDVDEEFLIENLFTLLKYKAPVIKAKIQWRYKRVLITCIDQKGISN
jgi:hypothetical protein